MEQQEGMDLPGGILTVAVTCTMCPQFADRGVAMSAVDMMSLLSEVGSHMLKLYPSMPFKVVQAICYAIAGKGLLTSGGGKGSAEWSAS